MPISRSLEQVWICPPLAFARFGKSEVPLDNFHWADNDYAPRGTAETVIEPTWSFAIDAHGNISAHLPEEIQFRDGTDWRPVCPFFEVHGRWSDGNEGALTLTDLESIGIELANVTWEVHAANRKAFHYTGAEGDHVDARLVIHGDDHRKQPLLGRSPDGAKDPIVFPDKPIPMGQVQVIRPNEGFPELRVRVTAPKGLIYAPKDTGDRNLTALLPADQGKEKFLEEIETTLNPKSPWAQWVPENGDVRTNPGGLYAQEPADPTTKLNRSLGFMDDSNDGRIQVTLRGASLPGGELTAFARYTCCPPDFQPDRRPFTSLADDLTDLVKREEVLDPSFVEGANFPETELEIADLMQRVRETMEASNLDHQNLRSKLGNDGILVASGRPPKDIFPFEPQGPRPGHPFPLLEKGREHHARFLAYDVFKQRLAQLPELFDEWIRNPTAEREYYDRLMPALMRGSDSYPMTLTQRQYDLLAAWLRRVRAEVVSDECAS